MKILNLFGKPETAPVHLGTVEIQASNIRLGVIDAAIKHLSRASETNNDEKEPKTAQAQLAAEAFQGAMRLARNSERAATTAVEATVQTGLAVEYEVSQNTITQVSVPEQTAEQPLAPAQNPKEALLAEAQAKVAAALEKAAQK